MHALRFRSCFVLTDTRKQTATLDFDSCCKQLAHCHKPVFEIKKPIQVPDGLRITLLANILQLYFVLRFSTLFLSSLLTQQNLNIPLLLAIYSYLEKASHLSEIITHRYLQCRHCERYKINKTICFC